MAENKINAPGTTAGLSTGGGTDAGAVARDTVDVLRAGREQAFEEAKTKVREAADAQRRRAAEVVGGMAGALHRAASDINAENEIMGRYTDMAAERLDEAAHYLRDTNWNQVIEGAEDFARRQPYWFIGGAVAAGFVLARVIKNSGEAIRPPDTAARQSQPMVAAGYGTSTEAGMRPPGAATTAPMSAAGTAAVPGGEV